jgi:glycosyltransferase involved in cell wall biosynthesis
MVEGGISILISTYNGASRLGETLEALSKLDVSDVSFIELILIDNASTDDTTSFVKKKWASLGAPFEMRCLFEKKPGKLNAQETGLQHAKGEFILICDDDNSLFSDYLKIGLNYFERYPEIGVLGGQGLKASSIEFPEWFEAKRYYYGCAPQAPATGNVRPHRNVVYGAGMWFRHDLYKRAKLLGYEFILGSRVGDKLITGGEDSELCWMIIFQGYQVWYIDEMKFYHHITPNRLNEKYVARLLEGMTDNGLNATIHLRIWNDKIIKNVRFFWLKELFYTLVYITKNSFKRTVDNLNDLKRAKNNVKILLSDRFKYDAKVNQILNFKKKCVESNLETIND